MPVYLSTRLSNRKFYTALQVTSLSARYRNSDSIGLKAMSLLGLPLISVDIVFARYVALSD
jgi:hypothetical protein